MRIIPKILFMLILFLPTNSLAQNTGGVLGPLVSEGREAIQYRFTYNPDTEGFAQRLHYEQALDADRMWRVIGQTRKTDDQDFDFDYVQGEFFLQLSDDDAAWKKGIRFDGRIRGDGRPGFVGLNYMTQTNVTEAVSFRFVVLSSVELGDNARDGIFLQTRNHLNRKLENGHNIGVELFSAYGSTDEFLDFEDQSHQLGPYGAWNVAPRWNIFTGALFGVTDGAPDTELRFWLTRSLR